VGLRISLRQVSMFATDRLLLSRVPAHRTRGRDRKEAREGGRGREEKGRQTGGEGARGEGAKNREREDEGGREEERESGGEADADAQGEGGDADQWISVRVPTCSSPASSNYVSTVRARVCHLLRRRPPAALTAASSHANSIVTAPSAWSRADGSAFCDAEDAVGGHSPSPVRALFRRRRVCADPCTWAARRKRCCLCAPQGSSALVHAGRGLVSV